MLEYHTCSIALAAWGRAEGMGSVSYRIFNAMNIENKSKTYLSEEGSQDLREPSLRDLVRSVICSFLGLCFRQDRMTREITNHLLHCRKEDLRKDDPIGIYV